MSYKKIFVLPALALAIGAPAHAANPVLGSLDAIPNLGGAIPLNQDYTFSNTNLNAQLTTYGSGYALNVYNSPANTAVTFDLLQKSEISATANYSLTAYFDSSNRFQSGSLTITGSLNPGYSLPAGATAPTSNVLYAANLTNFGFNDNINGDNQYAFGFQTQFTDSWANQIAFTGGSSGEVVYLFGNVLNSSSSPVRGLVDAFNNPNGLALLLGSAASYNIGNSVNSLATVPLPLPAVLFGAGLTALMGLGRQSRKPSTPV